jgi:hypothetical protein
MENPSNNVEPKGFAKWIGWIVAVILIGSAVAILLSSLGGGSDSTNVQPQAPSSEQSQQGIKLN